MSGIISLLTLGENAVMAIKQKKMLKSSNRMLRNLTGRKEETEQRKNRKESKKKEEKNNQTSH